MSSTFKYSLITRVVACNPKAFQTSDFLQRHFHNLSGNIQPQNHGIPKLSKITKFENDQHLARTDVLVNNIINGVYDPSMSTALRLPQSRTTYMSIHILIPSTRDERYHWNSTPFLKSIFFPPNSVSVH